MAGSPDGLACWPLTHATRCAQGVVDARASIAAAAVAAREVGANLELEGGVELRRVSFAYPHRPERLVLKEFNLVVPQGTSCALVGWAVLCLM